MEFEILRNKSLAPCQIIKRCLYRKICFEWLFFQKRRDNFKHLKTKLLNCRHLKMENKIYRQFISKRS